MKNPDAKILIVEDHEVNLELVSELLRISGYTVLEARDAEHGITLARDELPELILMDVGLPGMDGLEATKILKNDPATRNILIVALSAHIADSDVELALNTGCDGYITKPIDTREFLKTVEGFLKVDA
jgi:CheY-like chemotaxis protein